MTDLEEFFFLQIHYPKRKSKFSIAQSACSIPMLNSQCMLTYARTTYSIWQHDFVQMYFFLLSHGTHMHAFNFSTTNKLKYSPYFKSLEKHCLAHSLHFYIITVLIRWVSVVAIAVAVSAHPFNKYAMRKCAHFRYFLFIVQWFLWNSRLLFSQ